MDTLTVALYGSLLVAVVACVAAAASSRLRVAALVVAGCFYAVAGVLGILSIGVLFVAAAALCFTLAARARTSREVGLSGGR